MAEYEVCDNALMGILQHAGNIRDFLHIVFGFLYRKTDFYQIMLLPNDNMGFPPGVAEDLVLKIFKMYDKKAERDRKKVMSSVLFKKQSPAVPVAVKEVEVTSESFREADPAGGGDAAGECKATKCVAAPAGDGAASAGDGAASAGDGAASAGDGAASAGDVAAPGKVDVTTKCNLEAAAAPEAAAKEVSQTEADSYNGAVRENYTWSQDFHDVEVRVTVPKTIVKGRQVHVNLQSNRVKVSVMDGIEEKLLMEGELSNRISMENSMWSLEPGKCVVLSLSKVSETWWNAILKDEEQIDVNRIARERGMESVDEEEHAVLDRLSYDYHQKMQGKPQSHEQKVHEMLKKGWNAEGSPFKGQEFDPSMFKITSDAVQF